MLDKVLFCIEKLSNYQDLHNLQPGWEMTQSVSRDVIDLMMLQCGTHAALKIKTGPKVKRYASGGTRLKL